MGRPARALRAVLWLCLALAAPSPDASAETRLALVMANGAYQKAPPLPNPPNDGRLMAGALRQVGFSVQEASDLDLRGMQRALRVFYERVAASGGEVVALIYYAGHAVQLRGVNYLFPVDADIGSEMEVESEGLRMDLLMEWAERSRGTLNIFILDACRDNPFLARHRSLRGGLAGVFAPADTIIAYSTAPGQLAEDGDTGANSPYAAALARTITEPGLRIEDVFKRVRRSVAAATQGRQLPWESYSLMGDFYPAGSPGTVTLPGLAPQAGPPGPTMPQPRAPQTAPLATPSREAQAAKPGATQPAAPAASPSLVAAPQIPAPPISAPSLSALTGTGERPAPTPAATPAASPPQPAPQGEQRLAALPPANTATTRPAAPPRKTGDIFRDCPDCPELVVVPAGSALVGAVAGQGSTAARGVGIGRALAIGRFEITRDQFERHVTATGAMPSENCWTFEENTPRERAGRSFRDPGHPQTGAHPAVCVEWARAQGYADWLSRMTGQAYRLLTDEEWEYAALAGTSTQTAATADLCKIANAADQTARAARLPGDWAYIPCEDGYAYTAPAGSFAPNGLGLFDMTGNVWEWTQACDPQVTGAAAAATTCDRRVVRGGSWYGGAAMVGPGARADAPAGGRFDDIGFRIARELAP